MQKEGPAAGQSWNVLGGFCLIPEENVGSGRVGYPEYKALPPWLPWAFLGEANKAGGVKER